jgi:hypothetical protein
LRDFLQRWWQRLTGRTYAEPEAVAPPAPARRANPRPTPRTTHTASGATPAGELELVDESARPPQARGASAGADPYSNDAGYAKPRGWELIDRD